MEYFINPSHWLLSVHYSLSRLEKLFDVSYLFFFDKMRRHHESILTIHKQDWKSTRMRISGTNFQSSFAEPIN